MKDVEIKEVKVESTESELVWRKPELVVISMDKTKSGTNFTSMAEGTFYSPAS